MLVRWTTSRWADWETRESDDREIMWSHIPAKVLHCGGRERWGEQIQGEMERQVTKREEKVIEIGFGPRGMPWPSWRMKQKSFHLIVPHCHFHHCSAQTVSCPSLSAGMPERPCQGENNTANPEVHGWHSGKHLNYPAQIAFAAMHLFLRPVIILFSSDWTIKGLLLDYISIHPMQT